MSGVQISHANEYVIAPAVFPLTLPPASSRPFLGPGQCPRTGPSPAPPYTEHDPEVVGPNSMTPPPAYTESDLRVVIDDSKTHPHACHPPFHSLRNGLSPNPDDGGLSLDFGAPEETSSLQLCDCRSAGLGTRSAATVTIPTFCATICTSASKHLNYHVSPDNDVYRWQTTEGSIPIGINISSFESRKQGSMVKRCLKIVLRSFNDKKVGLKFQFVKDPGRSAFSVIFGGDHHHSYASSFFPGSHPKDWDIYIYKPGLTLSEDQEQLLVQPGGGVMETARIKALEQNLIKILAHEMLHIVGLRHCVIDRNMENEPYVRFPPGLSDHDNLDPLMQPRLDWMDFSRITTWKPQTLQEIRQIYAMNEGETVGCHIVRGVSWRDGTRVRQRMARTNVQHCISSWRNDE